VPLQILAVPVIVGIAYEGIRLGAGRERSKLVRAMMQPGLWLQMLTTKPPSPDMIEVAIRSLEQVLPPAERARVAPLPSPLVAGPGAVVEADLAAPAAPATPEDPKGRSSMPGAHASGLPKPERT
jgi:Protein of unknown function (DUF1385)